MESATQRLPGPGFNIPLPRKRLATLVLSFAIIIVLIGIQIGSSIYLSTQFIGFVFLMLYLLRAQLRFLSELTSLLILALASFLVAHIQFSNSAYGLEALLRSLREFTCFVVLIVVFMAARKRTLVVNIAPYAFYFASFGTLLLTAIQGYYLLGGLSFNPYIPDEFFAQETGTIHTDYVERAMLDGWEYIIRPSGFYAEPSYLGFMSLCSYWALHERNSFLRNMCIFCVLMLTCLLAKTGAGTILLALNFTVLNFSLLRRVRLGAVAYIVGAIIVFYLILPYLNRLINSGDSAVEASGYTRLVYPLDVMIHVWGVKPLGVPPLYLAALEDVDFTAVQFTALDNGFVNVFIYYGVLGFGIWVFLGYACGSFRALLFLISCSLYNGSIFSYDKVLVISVALMCQCRQHEKISTMITHGNSNGFRGGMGARYIHLQFRRG